MNDTPLVVLQDGGRWLRFIDPVRVVVARRPSEVAPALRTVETAVARDRLYAAGFLGYEAGAAFGLATHNLPTDAPPLLWFGLYERPQVIAPPEPAATGYTLGAWRPSLSESAYSKAIARIKAHIARGESYQVNFTFPLHAPFSGDPWPFFVDLVRAQQATYTAYLDLGRYIICSASPELFLRLDRDCVTARPMKGTTKRGRTLDEDQERVAWLQQSEKNRAENVMIVDMIRNDLGRIAVVGSVNVPTLFHVERYPTVLQMTSAVAARSDAPLSAILAATFPSASVTGAPKVRTMQIIQALEQGPRGVYTGAIGFVAPGRRAQLNVAIRTVVVDRVQGVARYDVGSGVVWDSVPEEEYAECLLKARVLTEKRPSFALLESLLWTPEEGYFLLDYHLARLGASAAYFSYAADLGAIHACLEQFAATLTAAAKVRLLVDERGAPQPQATSLANGATVEPMRLALAQEPVSTENVWLYHKTTRREVYEAARAARPDGDEVLLWNERGELTEATSANLVLRLDGKLVTPPIASGLLAGTMRQWLLENGRIAEQTVRREELVRAEEIFLINSVRKWRKAILLNRYS